ncbi:unnamed protein product, partial [Durusdinium trenchii]
MLRSSLRPNVIHFNAAVAACEEADAWPSALELLRQMLQHSVQGSVLSFNRTMAAMSSEWRKSLALLEEMPSHQVAPCATTDGRFQGGADRGSGDGSHSPYGVTPVAPSKNAIAKLCLGSRTWIVFSGSLIRLTKD